jgi:hypothetical protein
VYKTLRKPLISALYAGFGEAVPEQRFNITPAKRPKRLPVTACATRGCLYLRAAGLENDLAHIRHVSPAVRRLAATIRNNLETGVSGTAFSSANMAGTFGGPDNQNQALLHNKRLRRRCCAACVSDFD